MRHFSDLGKMDRLIYIRNYAISNNRLGHNTSTAFSETLINAAYSFNKGQRDESDIAGKQTLIKSEYYIIRWRSDVTLLTKVVSDGIEYDIVNIELIQRKRFLKLEVKRAI